MAAESPRPLPPPPPPPPNLDDYTPSATLIPFQHPIPILRGPLRASSSDNPEAGPLILAFKDPQSWASAYKACESQITQQCEAGARIGCSLAASNKCKPSWWKTLTGGVAKQDYAERAKCEEREMEACLETAKDKCREFSKNKCMTAFRDAKVAIKGLDLVRNRWEVSKLLSWVCLEGNKHDGMVEMMKFGTSWVEFTTQFNLTSCKGSDLLGSGNAKDVDDFLRRNGRKM
ncbi:uncharacterized protein LOC113753171 [Coffea eugenioides]|uniref:uncharacterized protein LOC113753171 n=1 Tax=Coffea eugenioides TaxID=49369 RepID=UPI000F6136CA|nr:uncharacterized protein LOC113753171 [Coffea eugenioides]XP_027153174.1 uncharacterized protein LOC113753171 [Coffea eugenioides]XP_027153248.1 uncharacterized protein LOC113753171 [Coffea eugenioides]